MKVVIAGGTGFLGQALAASLGGHGHEVVVLTRRPRRNGDVAWSPESGDRRWWPAVDGSDAVVNLAGESIALARWSAERKARIRDSRVTATEALTASMLAARRPPATFLSGSAIGIYGVLGDQPVTEETPPGTDFLATVGREWERQAIAAASRTRVVLLRTGLVLARTDGALPRLALPFRLFAGGPMGSGAQYVSWIHLDDWVAMVRWALTTPAVLGPLNVTAPSPVTNRELATTLGRVLGRPSFLPAPAFALRLALGEMADALILGGQRVLPEKARRLGFEFRYAHLEAALRNIYV